MSKIVSPSEQMPLYNFASGLDTNLFYTFPLLPGLRTKLWQQLAAILQDQNPNYDYGRKEISQAIQAAGLTPEKDKEVINKWIIQPSIKIN
ncbi:MAG: hypothetical protein GXY49_05550 [Syntrophomonadaceae bacterium]|nr:hypothetical protein [Syntrophomonadaceae bacterium]